MISDVTKKTRQMAYEIAKINSEKRGVSLTQETETVMKKYINGEISDQDFFNHVSKMAEGELGPPAHRH